VAKTNEILETLGISEGINRAAVISALAAGKPVKPSALNKKLYGADDAQAATKLHFVLIGIREKCSRVKGIKLAQSTDDSGETIFTPTRCPARANSKLRCLLCGQ
jgi:hypothetical protein